MADRIIVFFPQRGEKLTCKLATIIYPDTLYRDMNTYLIIKAFAEIDRRVI